jgi:tetratricopeptide (TPR) repeat protein
MVALNYVYPIVQQYPIYTEKGSVGVTFKYYNLKMKDENDKDSSFYSCDFGFIYLLDFIDRNLTGGLAVKNIGNDMEIKNIFQKQTETAAASARYLISEDYKVSFMADMVKNLHITDTGFACGLETVPFYPLSLRVGWRDYRDNFNKGLTAGFSLDFDKVHVAYSYSDILDTSDDQHTFSLGFYFGAISDSGKAYDHYLGYYLNMAKDAYLKKNYISARQQFEDILSIYPEEPVAKHYLQLLSDDLDQTDRDVSSKVDKYLAKADVALLRNNVIKAKKYYTKILVLDKENEQALEGLKKVEAEVAEQEIYKNRKKYAKEITQSWVKAMKYFDNGEFVYAKEELLKIVKIDPSNAGALQYLDFIQKKVDRVNEIQANDIFKQGVKEYNEENYEKALTFFNAAYISSPDRTDIKEYIDSCNEKINMQRKKDTAALPAAVPSSPASSQPSFLTNKQVEEQMKRVYNTGLEQFSQKDYNAALKTFNTLKTMSLKNKFFEYNEQIKNYISKCNEALADNLYNQAKDLEMKEELDKAYDMYKEVLKYVPNHKEAKKEMANLNSVVAQKYYDQGLKAFSEGDKEKAVEYLKQSLEYDPNKLEAKRALDRIK